MNAKNAFILSFLLLVIALPSFQSGQFMLQWWSGYLSKLWSSIWGSISGFAASRVATPVTVQQQFLNQLSSLQNKTQSFSSLYASDAQKYSSQFTKQKFDLNQSWSVQITDRNSTTSPIIGNMTLTWLGPSRRLSIERGIVGHNVSPTYSVTATHKAFIALSGDAIRMDVFSGIADYLTYNASRSISARSVR